MVRIVLVVVLVVCCYVASTSAATFLNMASLPSVPMKEENAIGQTYASPPWARFAAMVPALADIVAYGLNMLFMVMMGGVALMAVGPLMALARSSSIFSKGRTDLRQQEDASISPQSDSILMTVWNGMDMVESTFKALRVRTEGCRRRLACEISRDSQKNFWMGIALGWLRNRLERKESYREAVGDGLRNHDCMQQYPDCSYSFADTLKLRGR